MDIYEITDIRARNLIELYLIQFLDFQSSNVLKAVKEGNKLPNLEYKSQFNRPVLDTGDMFSLWNFQTYQELNYRVLQEQNDTVWFHFHKVAQEKG